MAAIPLPAAPGGGILQPAPPQNPPILRDIANAVVYRQDLLVAFGMSFFFVLLILIFFQIITPPVLMTWEEESYMKQISLLRMPVCNLLI